MLAAANQKSVFCTIFNYKGRKFLFELFLTNSMLLHKVIIYSILIREKLVFNMRYFEEMKYEEISEILETSVGGLKASYHLAAKKIESYLKDEN